MKPLVIYHADCTDGFGAAYAAWLKLGDDAEYLPMQYNACDYDIEGAFFNLGNPEHGGAMLSIRSREVYILDFSFPRPVMDVIFAEAKRVVWLDHHKSAFEMWTGVTCAQHYSNVDGHHIELNNNKSGALLAWEYFHPDKEVPQLIRHIDDRDRWQFKLEGSKELNATLWSYRPWNFERWGEIDRQLQAWGDHNGDFPHYLFKEGAAILRAQNQNIAQIAKQARKCCITQLVAGGAWLSLGNGLAVNSPIHQSEIGHELANQSGTFGLVWYLDTDSRVKCSLRSNGEYDVSAIARAFSGGGHRNAAGFETDIETLMGWLK